MKFKTKAQNLVALSRTNINIPKIFKFNVKDYVRSWTFKDLSEKRIMTNGLSILQS